MNTTSPASVNKRFYGILCAAAGVLLLPLTAMFFTDEVDWSLFDFLVAAVLLFGTGFSLEFILRKVRNPMKKAVGVLVLFAVLLLVWAELAVGIFGTPFAGS